MHIASETRGYADHIYIHKMMMSFICSCRRKKSRMLYSLCGILHWWKRNFPSSPKNFEWCYYQVPYGAMTYKFFFPSGWLNTFLSTHTSTFICTVAHTHLAGAFNFHCALTKGPFVTSPAADGSGGSEIKAWLVSIWIAEGDIESVIMPFF